MSGVFDLAGPVGARDSAPTGVAFPPNEQRRHPDFQAFRGSIPRLHVPLSTLRVQPYDWPRMTRGQDGSLHLSCTALSSATPCRFRPALSPTPFAGPISSGGNTCVFFLGAAKEHLNLPGRTKSRWGKPCEALRINVVRERPPAIPGGLSARSESAPPEIMDGHLCIHETRGTLSDTLSKES